jgi:outer membrane protein assembly factor BamB
MFYRNYLFIVLVFTSTTLAGDNSSSPLVAKGLLKEAGLGQIWQTKLAVKADEQIDRLYLLGDKVYTLTSSNYLFGLDRNNGNVVFGMQLAPEGFPVLDPQLCGNELLVVAGNTLARINPVQGTVTHKFKFDYTVTTPVVQNKAIFYVAGAKRRVYAMDTNENVHIFEVAAENDSEPTTVLATDKYMVFTTDKGNVICILANVPQLVWQFNTADSITASLVMDNNDLYVSSWDTKVYKLDVATGKQQWKAELGGMLKTSPCITPNAVYQHVDNKGLTAIDKKSGVLLWTVDDGIELLAEIGSKTYVMAANRTVAVVDTAGGRQLFSVNFAQTILQAANTVDGKIYVADRAGRVACITAAK